MLDSELQQYLTYTQFLLRSVDLPQLLETLKESSAGYPTGHEGRQQVEECAECEGRKCVECGYLGTVVVTSQSRTEGAAVSPDPARDARKAIERDVRALRNAAVNLHGAMEAWLRTADTKKAKGQGEPGCRSCERLKNWAPVHRDERCKWCYEWWLANKQEPPIPLLRAHHEGRRITSALERRLMGNTKKAS